VASCFKTTELTVEIDDDGLWLERAADLKDRLSEKLKKEGDTKTALVLDNCGTELRMRCTECHHLTIAREHCKKRYCPLCAPMIAAERVAKHRKAVEAIQWPLFITLTKRNETDLTRSTLTSLLHAFRKLRQRVLWKRTVKGGWVSLEITNRGKGWHPHLHIIADCEWLSLKTSPPPKWWSRERKAAVYKEATAELEAEWAALMNQPTASVRTRRVFGAEGKRNVAVEAMKYTVKAEDMVEHKGRATEVVNAMKGTRLFRGFGTCAKLKLDDDEPREPSVCECGAVGCVRPEHVIEKSARFARK
jgi:hypothetical protein